MTSRRGAYWSMKNWKILPTINTEYRASQPDVSPIILQLLYNRGLKDATAIDDFFNLADFYDPFLFRHMAAAVDLIIGHIKAGHKIVVYGDYDADGVTSAVILWETLKILHGVVEVYLPDRVSEGYGLNQPALDQIAAQGAKLLITVDNGTRNKSEVAYAKQLGLDVIITDHHVVPEEEQARPDCLFINPSDPADHYPWRYLCGVGVAFKLVSALLAKANLSDSQKQLIQEKCLDLVAVGTVADMVSLLGENRLLVKKGLEILNQERRLGLRELIKVAKINSGRPLEAWNIGWQIGPRLNAASRLGHANSAFSLLTTIAASEAKALATELNNRNLSRQKITAEIFAQVEEQIDPDNLPLIIIGVAPVGQVWNEGVIGLVAGRITEKYHRPSLIVTRLEGAPSAGGFKASGRSIAGFNLIQALEECSEFLDKYGGHPMACGFFINEASRLDKFKNKILAWAEQTIDPVSLTPQLNIDAALDFSLLSLELAAAINKLAPFGEDNPQPRLVSYNLRVDDIVTMGAAEQHIKLRLSSFNPDQQTAKSFWAVGFSCPAEYKKFKVGDRLDLVYHLEINEFNGRREPQLKIVDVKSSAPVSSGTDLSGAVR